jgi:hypothetical protein
MGPKRIRNICHIHRKLDKFNLKSPRGAGKSGRGADGRSATLNDLVRPEDINASQKANSSVRVTYRYLFLFLAITKQVQNRFWQSAHSITLWNKLSTIARLRLTAISKIKNTL